MSTDKKNKEQGLKTTLSVGLAIMTCLLGLTPVMLQEFVGYCQSNFDYYCYIATQYENMGDYDHAIIYFEKSIESNPENPAPYNELAWLYVEKTNTNFEEAIVLAQKAVDLAQADEKFSDDFMLANYLDTLGWAYYKNGEYVNAITTLERAIELTNQESFKLHLESAQKALEAMPTPTNTALP